MDGWMDGRNLYSAFFQNFFSNVFVLIFLQTCEANGTNRLQSDETVTETQTHVRILSTS